MTPFLHLMTECQTEGTETMQLSIDNNIDVNTTSWLFVKKVANKDEIQTVSLFQKINFLLLFDSLFSFLEFSSCSLYWISFLMSRSSKNFSFFGEKKYLFSTYSEIWYNDRTIYDLFNKTHFFVFRMWSELLGTTYASKDILSKG